MAAKSLDIPPHMQTAASLPEETLHPLEDILVLDRFGMLETGLLRLGGKGLPDVNGYGRGDELVVVDITIPSKLSAEEKRLVEQLAQQPGFQHAESVKNQNIFERMKSFIR